MIRSLENHILYIIYIAESVVYLCKIICFCIYFAETARQRDIRLDRTTFPRFSVAPRAFLVYNPALLAFT